MLQMNRTNTLLFVCEMKILSMLNHPNIIRFIGTICESPHICLVTEFAQLGSLKMCLRSAIKTGSHTWLNFKKGAVDDIIAGMNYLHSLEKPIVHRDLKTSNCLVMEHWQVKICDFGLARGMPEVLSPGDSAEMSTGVGTPGFVAPEVLTGSKYNEKIDVYSFGMLLADIAMDGYVHRLQISSSFNSGNGNGNGKGNGNSDNSVKFPIRFPSSWQDEIPLIQNLIKVCLELNPKKRPPFERIQNMLKCWDGMLENNRELPRYFNMSKYSKKEEIFFEDCLKITQDNYVLGKGEWTPWQSLKSRDPESKMERRFNSDYGAGIGKCTRVINAHSSEVLRFFWDWMSKDRLKANKNDLERSIIHVANEHNQIVLTVKESILHFLPRTEYVLRYIWKEVGEHDNFIICLNR